MRDYFFKLIKQDKKTHIEFLLSHIDPTLLKEINAHSQTPLIAAINHKAPKVARFLAEHGSSSNKADPRGRMPLIEAINKMPELVDYLLNRKADANQADNTGTTPLIAAIKKNNIDIVKSLVGWGANIMKLDQKGNLPLVAAITNEAPEIVNYLMVNAGAPLYQTDAHGVTPLLAAIQIQNVPLVNQLLLRGASVHKQELEAAEKTGNKDILQLLSKEMPRKKKSKFLFWRK